MVPYREEMGKRHLKVTGDLGRVAFIVRSETLREYCEETHRVPGVRFAEHRVDRGGSQTLRYRLQLGGPNILDQVRSTNPRDWRLNTFADGLHRNFSLEDVHVDGTARIAEAVAKYDVDRFIHVSSYNADPNSPASFFATKGRGEQVARSIYPETTIVRPAPLFGFEDNLLLKLAGLTNVFTSNNMQERFWPVHVSESNLPSRTTRY